MASSVEHPDGFGFFAAANEGAEPTRALHERLGSACCASLAVLVVGLVLAGGAARGDEPSRADEARDAVPADMVEVPTGQFLMGCNAAVDDQCDDDEKPGRQVKVAAFRIDRTEVTVAQYAACVRAGACTDARVVAINRYVLPTQFCNWKRLGRERHPINCVDWQQARAFCTWAGKRLPSEAEWEKAARGSDGRKYPWGNDGYAQVGERVANVADEATRGSIHNPSLPSGYFDGWIGTAPVGSFPDGRSPYGADDMMGNVREWVETRLEGGNEVDHGVRGGSWFNHPFLARASQRYYLDSGDASIGFRCAQ